ncbi:single-stranded-DNA-specific exonuclease RecJ [Philodulcilactobacillus myokoensis]|uniref:Single-stranded-DNA-specific exonuclease RecJ n=1 Tax=Philodulcilactobacillus myokoensis TaxID=2929573 RepID=A0A9W6ESF1_9LACO|nr:single-stranded-DNA-specific exonuclease RecJ [Philodulcilactobacillus myokoensis]GLB46971.1 single-stranded-DNA-specific exonuclease RecJ [Philodulcilactobacillus myokoensis]
MLASKYKWNLQDLKPEKNLAKQLNLNPLILSILKQRGYQNEEEIEHFLKPTLDQMRSPFLIHDMKKGIQRIKKAIADNEKITVYGDYDADGLTSTSIMYEVLNDIGANVDYYIPNRFTDGYGPNTKAFKKIINDGTSLIITVDNGISGYDQIEVANQMNCDVIISDHHDFPKKIPHAYAIIHARYPGHEYPFGDFSGAGIAFKIACALLNEIPEELLDLASIGTVADLVSLTDENRIIVKNGLKIMADTQRLGLQSLMQNADLNVDYLNEESISFGIAPRLNALGRMGDANIGVRLLTTFDDELAKQLADFIEAQNNKRKQLVTNITKSAVEKAQTGKNKDRKTLVIAGKNWHEGVVGIVASRIVETFNKPTLILNINPKNHTAKGSGRSIDGFNLFKALDHHRDDMISFGGHPMAVGLTINSNKLDALVNDLESAGEDQHLKLNHRKNIKVAEKISIDDISLSFYKDLLQLAPFGTDNERPIFEIKPSFITDIKTMGKDNTHLSFKINGKHKFLKVIAFKKGYLAKSIASMPSQIAMIGSISLNHWRGRDSIQIMMKDIKGIGTAIIDRRTRFLTKSIFNTHGLYIFFHSSLMHHLKDFCNEQSTFVMFNHLPDDKRFDNIIFVDCPDRLSDLYGVFERINPTQLFVYFYKKQRATLDGIPSRNQFIKFFRLIQTKGKIDLTKDFDLVVEQTKLSKSTVIFMIQLFIELGFVSVQDEMMIFNHHPKKQSIQDASRYHLREQQIKTEQQLLLQPTSNLISLISRLLNKKKEVLD